MTKHQAVYTPDSVLNIKVKNKTIGIRVLAINDKTWFLAHDIAVAIDYNQATTLTATVAQENKTIVLVRAEDESVRRMILIDKEGMIDVLNRSPKSMAKTVLNKILEASQQNTNTANTTPTEQKEIKEQSEFKKLSFTYEPDLSNHDAAVISWHKENNEKMIYKQLYKSLLEKTIKAGLSID